MRPDIILVVIMMPKLLAYSGVEIKINPHTIPAEILANMSTYGE